MSPLFVTVVLQKFTANVYDVYVIRGNAALLRCHVPPVVKDYVRVTSWVRDDGVTVGNLGSTGKLRTAHPCRFIFGP